MDYMFICNMKPDALSGEPTENDHPIDQFVSKYVQSVAASFSALF